MCTTIAFACNRESVALEMNLLDLDMDSLTFMTVLSQVEAAFAIDLTPDDVLTLLYVAHVSELADRLEEIIVSATRDATPE